MRYAALLIVLAGCPLRNPVPVEPDYPSAHVCGVVCANLRRVGCHEGYGSVSNETCERTCQLASELRPMPLQCWADAIDAVAAISCGSLRCTR